MNDSTLMAVLASALLTLATVSVTYSVIQQGAFFAGDHYQATME